jgi:hypothetical protein
VAHVSRNETVLAFHEAKLKQSRVTDEIRHVKAGEFQSAVLGLKPCDDASRSEFRGC